MAQKTIPPIPSVQPDGSANPAKPWVPNFITPSTSVDGLANCTLATSLPSGRYDLFVRALDAANNHSDWERRQFSVGFLGNTAPITAITNPAINNAKLTPSPQIQGTVFDDNPSPVSSVEVNIRDTVNHKWVQPDGSANPARPWVPNFITPSTSIDGLANWTLATTLPSGRYDLFVRALDAADNHSAWERRQFSIGSSDTTAPTTTVSNPSVSNAVLTPSAQFQGTVFDDNPSPVVSVEINIRNVVSNAWVELDGCANTSATWDPFFVTPAAPTSGLSVWSMNSALPVGYYMLYVRANDTAGNTSSWQTVQFSVAQ